MKIGIATQRIVDGDGQGSINRAVVHAALERGHSVTLLATEIDADLRDHPSITWIPITVGRWPTQLFRDQVFAWKARRHIRRIRPTVDLLMVNGAITWTGSDVNALHFVHSAWLASETRTSNTRSTVYSWYRSLYAWVNAAWEKWSLRRTRHAVAVSPKVKKEIDALNVRVPVTVIENGVDTTRFNPEGNTVPKAELECPSHAPVALFVGDIRSSIKNLETVLRALREVPEMHLIVAGDSDGSPFPKRANQLRIADRVHFLGFRQDIPALMRTADLFVFPSQYESFSLVLLEAMATGTPVITARTVGAAELVGPDCGIVLEEPNDPHTLAESMRTLVADDERRRAMGRAARQTAKRYRIETTGHRYVDLFESMKSPSSSTQVPKKNVSIRTPPRSKHTSLHQN